MIFVATGAENKGSSISSLDAFGVAIPAPDSVLFPAYTSRQEARFTSFGGNALIFK